jgi:plasmid stability protein
LFCGFTGESIRIRRPQSNEEVTHMSEVSPAASQQPDTGSKFRPLSVGVEDNVRAQLEIIAQLNERSVPAEARCALEYWIEKSKTDPKVLARAAQVRAEIERESATKQGAIAAIFDAPTATKEKRPATPPAANSARSAKPANA